MSGTHWPLFATLKTILSQFELEEQPGAIDSLLDQGAKAMNDEPQ
jgi:hypothetical protein